MERLRITELLGDGIGPELRESVHAVAGVAAAARPSSCPSTCRSRAAARNPDVYDAAGGLAARDARSA